MTHWATVSFSKIDLFYGAGHRFQNMNMESEVSVTTWKLLPLSLSHRRKQAMIGLGQGAGNWNGSLNQSTAVWSIQSSKFFCNLFAIGYSTLISNLTIQSKEICNVYKNVACSPFPTKDLTDNAQISCNLLHILAGMYGSHGCYRNDSISSFGCSSYPNSPPFVSVTWVNLISQFECSSFTKVLLAVASSTNCCTWCLSTGNDNNVSVPVHCILYSSDNLILECDSWGLTRQLHFPNFTPEACLPTLSTVL
jgi:hypothetical protein